MSTFFPQHLLCSQSLWVRHFQSGHCRRDSLCLLRAVWSLSWKTRGAGDGVIRNLTPSHAWSCWTPMHGSFMWPRLPYNMVASKDRSQRGRARWKPYDFRHSLRSHEGSRLSYTPLFGAVTISHPDTSGGNTDLSERNVSHIVRTASWEGAAIFGNTI